jgi:hypothetical protein
MVPGIKELLVFITLCLSAAERRTDLHEQAPAVGQTATVSASEPVRPAGAPAPAAQCPGLPSGGQPEPHQSLKEALVSLGCNVAGLLVHCLAIKLFERYSNGGQGAERKLVQGLREKCSSEFRCEIQILDERVAQVEAKMDVVLKAVKAMKCRTFDK